MPWTLIKYIPINNALEIVNKPRLSCPVLHFSVVIFFWFFGNVFPFEILPHIERGDTLFWEN
jgi:hypothetical protein